MAHCRGRGWRLALAATLFANVTAARPQLSVGWDNAVAGLQGAGPWSATRWYTGLRADLLLTKERYADVGLGPYLAGGSAGFDDARMSSGLVFEAPLPLVAVDLHAGGGVLLQGEPRGLLEVGGMLGVRGYHHGETLAMASGLFVTYQRGLGEGGRRSALLAGLRLDVMLVALPFAWLVGWTRSVD